MPESYEVVEIPNAGHVRVYPAEPGTDDASGMFVMDVLGATLLVRRRRHKDGAIDTYVHIDTDGVDAFEGPLRYEICNGGEFGED